MQGSWYGSMLMAAVVQMVQKRSALQALVFHPCVVSKALLDVFHSDGMLYSSVAVAHLDPKSSVLRSLHLRLSVVWKIATFASPFHASPSSLMTIVDRDPTTKTSWIPPCLDRNLDPHLSVGSKSLDPVLDAFLSSTKPADDPDPKPREFLFPTPTDRHPSSASQDSPTPPPSPPFRASPSSSTAAHNPHPTADQPSTPRHTDQHPSSALGFHPIGGLRFVVTLALMVVGHYLLTATVSSIPRRADPHLFVDEEDSVTVRVLDAIPFSSNLVGPPKRNPSPSPLIPRRALKVLSSSTMKE